MARRPNTISLRAVAAAAVPSAPCARLVKPFGLEHARIPRVGVAGRALVQGALLAAVAAIECSGRPAFARVCVAVAGLAPVVVVAGGACVPRPLSGSAARARKRKQQRADQDAAQGGARQVPVWGRAGGPRAGAGGGPRAGAGAGLGGQNCRRRAPRPLGMDGSPHPCPMNRGPRALMPRPPAKDVPPTAWCLVVDRSYRRVGSTGE